MAASLPPSPLGPEAPVGEILLAETAIRIELPPSLHRLAVERYGAVRHHIEREDSPLRDHVALFYPQGSMAIGATIKARKREDGYDIDIIAELMLHISTPPARVLDLLFEAVNGPSGSQYHGKVKRQTRCVTVEYEDGMHIDITPSILIDESDPRKSVIFHAKKEEPVGAHRRLLMNTHAFIEWFNDRTPLDLRFNEAYGRRALEHDRILLKAAAPAEPVPDHSTKEGGKSSTVVALQLLKRNRNIRYARREGRMPPSVMMACLAGDVAAPGDSISGALVAIAVHMLDIFNQAHSAGRLVEVRNPCCEGELFTDRWPENLSAQRVYIDDLKLLMYLLSQLMNENLPLDKKRALLVEMFGEGPAGSVIEDYSEQLARGIRNGTRRVGPMGRVVVGTAATGSTLIRPAAAHTFYGTSWRKK